MTCKEKLRIEHPDLVDPKYCGGECCGCPYHYGYAKQPDYCDSDALVSEELCSKCWNREIED